MGGEGGRRGGAKGGDRGKEGSGANLADSVGITIMVP